MKEQSGICPDANEHALFLCINRSKSTRSLEPIKRGVHEVPKTLDDYANEHKDARLSGVVAIGARFWDECY
ncbi:MAG: Dyp-type peroxidase, partial [Gammaproteobacteria bacterium]